MKSYTDIEQSKKLAEILPIESADMCYKCIGEDPYDVVLRPYSEWKEEYKGLLVGKEVDVVPCWSLAALLELMPKKIKYDGGIVYPEFHIWNNSFEYNNNADYVLHITNSYDNPVDACYEMILKLHEQNLL